MAAQAALRLARTLKPRPLTALAPARTWAALPAGTGAWRPQPSVAHQGCVRGVATLSRAARSQQGAPTAACEDQHVWNSVDEYFTAKLVPEAQDPALREALADIKAAGMPFHSVSECQGKFLALVARMVNARRVLEVGTLGGYSTIWLARAVKQSTSDALPHVCTLELDAEHARVAHNSIQRAGVADVVDVRQGRAAESMELLVKEAGVEDPTSVNARVPAHHAFDLIFIDADKPSNPEYLRWSLALSRPGTVIVADNVVRNGAVADEASADANVRGVRTFMDLVSDDQRLEASALQTVGCKGYDGFAVALVVQ